MNDQKKLYALAIIIAICGAFAELLVAVSTSPDVKDRAFSGISNVLFIMFSAIGIVVAIGLSKKSLPGQAPKPEAPDVAPLVQAVNVIGSGCGVNVIIDGTRIEVHTAAGLVGSVATPVPVRVPARGCLSHDSSDQSD